MKLEFVVPERPVSAQSRRQKNIQAWRTMVAECASAALGDAQIELSIEPIAIRVWYFYEEAMLDADNVVKPIQAR